VQLQNVSATQAESYLGKIKKTVYFICLQNSCHQNLE